MELIKNELSKYLPSFMFSVFCCNELGKGLKNKLFQLVFLIKNKFSNDIEFNIDNSYCSYIS